MTQNQINYGRLQEEKRHNQASEMADLLEAKAKDRTSLTDLAYKTQEMQYMGYDAQTRRMTAQAAASQASTRLSELAEAIRHNQAQERELSTRDYYDYLTSSLSARGAADRGKAAMTDAATRQSQAESDISRNVVRNVLDIIGGLVPGIKTTFDALGGMYDSFENNLYGRNDLDG